MRVGSSKPLSRASLNESRPVRDEETEAEKRRQRQRSIRLALIGIRADIDGQIYQTLGDVIGAVNLHRRDALSPEEKQIRQRGEKR